MRLWFERNPWIWLVLLVLFFLAGNALFLKIATSVPLEEIGR